ncbi:hypothetical protein NDN08_003899 [Rhodosorus marinus]|uniref:Uncharacterized protein n=1 Tax=Rhodosorus marinus TaxID=101924 RepID=A0AAV8UJF1_9RHOD|nr:hypothetical protein NDN08_003899 [Rhodosorus marinus]
MTSGATAPTVEDIELLDRLLGMSLSRKLKAQRGSGYGKGVQKTRQLEQRSREFETVRRYVDSDSGLSDDPASGSYVCGEVLTVTAKDLAVADSEFGERTRVVIEVQSTMDSSYIVRAYAYLRSDAMSYSS